MCLTIPKKVIGIEANGQIVLELFDGTRQTLKTMVALEIGDYCITLQNVAIEKISADEINELKEILGLKGDAL